MFSLIGALAMITALYFSIRYTDKKQKEYIEEENRQKELDRQNLKEIVKEIIIEIKEK